MTLSFPRLGRAGLLAVLCGLLLAACSRPALIQGHGTFASCDFTGSCVSSQSRDADFFVDPIEYVGHAEEARRIIRQSIRDMPRTQLVTDSNCYMHAEHVSGIVRRTDDLELWLCKKPGHIEVRSATRGRHYDFGQNRQRVESLRAALTIDPERPLHQPQD